MPHASSARNSKNHSSRSFNMNEAWFEYSITLQGVHQFFEKLNSDFVTKCATHQLAANDIYVLSAYCESGIFPKDVLRQTFERHSDGSSLKDTLAFATELIKHKHESIIENYTESKRVNLAWDFDGSEDSFVRWVISQYVGPSHEPPSIEAIHTLIFKDDLEDTERYFQFRAHKFYHHVYSPEIRAVKARARDLYEQTVEELNKKISIEKIRENMSGSTTEISAEDINRCMTQ